MDVKKHEKQCRLRIYGELNDFLNKKDRNHPIRHTYKGSPSVKDLIESLGIPHCEIALILMDEKPVQFDSKLQGSHYIAVYPYTPLLSLKTDSPVMVRIPSPPTFILDVHLGKLARWLRFIGMDTLHYNQLEDARIASIAENQDRVVLSRDLKLLMRKKIKRGRYIRNCQIDQQMIDVMRYFNLKHHLRPFTRCSSCNASLKQVDKRELKNIPDKKILARFDAFFQCTGCQKIYWKGSHHNKIDQRIQHLLRSL
jgi:hypothetical protein